LAIPVVRDWSATETITEAKLDEISTALNYLLAPPRVYAYKSSDGALASATWDALNLTAEAYDSGALHDNTTNNTRLVPTEPGLYGIVCHIMYDTNSSGIRGLDIRKNANAVQTGGTDLMLLIIDGNGTTQTRIAGYVEVQLTTSDYVEAFGYQNSGSVLNVIGGAANTFMSMRWLARTV
jgi:hypothetical protein